VQFGDVEVPMMFDTGATVTTLDTATLTRLGVRVPSDAPEITMHTANGDRIAKLVLMEHVWIGGLGVEGVTVGVCDACADDKSRGLLGLNVSSQFLVTLDTVRKEVVLQGREGAADRLIDVGPWLKVESKAMIWPDGRIEVEVWGQNRAERQVIEADIGITCSAETFRVRLANIPPRGKATTTSSLPRGANCETYKVSLDRARW